MEASKRAFNMTSNYRITSQNQYMGKLRCVQKTSELNLYTLFSPGDNPLKKRGVSICDRKELMQVTFSHHLSFQGMRNTNAIIPIDPEGVPSIKELSKEKSPLLYSFMDNWPFENP